MRHRAAMPYAFLWMLVLVGLPEVHAQRRLEITGLSQPEYGRLILRWAEKQQAEAPQLTAEARGGILTLRFEESIALDLETLPDALPEWIAFVRIERDQKGLRLALRGPAKIYVSRSDPLSAVDLILRGSGFRPPPIVSEQQRQQQLAAQYVPPPEEAAAGDLNIGLSSTPGDERHLIVFRWDKPVEYKAEVRPDGALVLKFALQANPDLKRLKLETPPGLQSFEAFNTIDGFRIRLTPNQPWSLSHYREGEVIHVALSRPQPELPMALDPEAAKAFSAGSAGPESPQDPLSTVLASSALPDNQTWLRYNWPDPVPGSGQVKVSIVPLNKGLKLSVGWDKPAPAAIFARNMSVWAVFGAEARFVIDTRHIPAGFLVRQIETPSASILHIETPERMQVEADASGSHWHILVRPAGARPARNIKLERRVSDTGRVSLGAALPTAAGIVWYRDTVIGDQIAAALAFGPGKGVAAGRRLLEADILPSAHGIAVIPKSDRVTVRLVGETLIVGTASGLAVTDSGSQQGLSRSWSGPGFMDFEAWGQESGSAFLERRYGLERQVALTDPKSLMASKSYLELARFYVGHDMGYEALGILELVFSARPLVRQDGRFLALRGVASIQAGRYESAEEWLSKSVLRGEKSSTLWRALAAARRGEWEKADQMFRTAEELILSYVPGWAAVFHAAAAEAALNVKDWEMAARHARQAALSGVREPSERAALVQAQLAYETRSPEEAYALLGEVAEMTADPTAVRAELLRFELGDKLGRISAGDIAEGLESLRYRWRGDALELQILVALTRQYMELGRFREALAIGGLVALQNPDAPGARALRRQSVEHFRLLFLKDAADRLDPIEALALFYEFRSLTPIGPDGDRMIRKLAGRLSRFDLLDQAAELLQHQIDSRVRGPGRAKIAADLASIYLLDRKPIQALSALRSTRHAGMPLSLSQQRRLLEATALSRMERHDHAIELVEELEGVDAAMVRAEAHWHKADWPGAAKALSDWLAADPDMKPDTRIMVAMQAAIASRMAEDSARLAQLRKTYMPVLKGTAQIGSFDLITAHTDTDGAALAEAVRRMSDLPRVDAFAAFLKARLSKPDTEKTPDKS